MVLLLMVLLETPNGKCFVCASGGPHRSTLFLLLFYCMCTCSSYLDPLALLRLATP
jgi:hypothetical protein